MELVRCGELVETDERGLDVADDRQRDAFVLVVLGRVDVDVDDLGVGRKFVGVAGDAVIEASAEAEQQVALVDGPVAIGGAVHAEPLHRERVGLRETADAHERGGDRDVGFFREGLEVSVSLGRNDAAAGVEDGALRLGDQGQHLFELIIRGLERRGRVAAAKLDRRRKHGLKFRLLHILRDVDDHGAGATAAGEVERLFENAR